MAGLTGSAAYHNLWLVVGAMTLQQPRSMGRSGWAPPPVLALARRPQAVSGVREAEKPKLPSKKVVEIGAGGRRRVVELGGAGASGQDPLSAGAAAGTATTTTISSGGSLVAVNGPVESVRSFFLPRGWPNSCTPDYLPYQLGIFPSHVAGHVSHSLATSSMITALGVSAGPAAVVATSAAIKWITKDGLGAAGRLIVGGRLASVFDEDPRRWRMVAEAITTLGLALEIATRVYPAYFVALAGAGTLCKSMAKGMGRPCLRVIQTHFSASNNVGDVAAKEEVWEVAAQLAGLAFSVLLLQALETTGLDSPQAVLATWAAVHGVHVVLRYTALSTLRFPYPNQKRAALLASSHVSTGTVPSIDEANAAENILLPPSYCRPRVVFGCTLDDALGSSSSSSNSSHQVEQLEKLLELYSNERYLLTWQDGTARVLLLEGAGKLELMRAMWQAAWLDHAHQHDHMQHATAAANSNGSSGSNGSSLFAAAAGSTAEQQLAASLAALQQQWPDFEAKAVQQGWQLDKAVILQGSNRLEVHT